VSMIIFKLITSVPSADHRAP